MTEPQNRQERIFSLVMDISIGLILFLLPLKFGLPFIPSLQPILPMGAGDWIVFCWPNEIIIAALFTLTFVWLAYGIIRGELRFIRDPGNITILIFTALTLISTVNTFDSFRSAQTVLLTLSYTACFFLFINNIRKERAHAFVLVMLSASAALVLFGLHQHFIGLEQTREWVSKNMDISRYPERFSGRLASNRVFATFVYPNALGGFLAMLVVPATVLIAIVRDRAAYIVPAVTAALIGCAALFIGGQPGYNLHALGFAAVWPLCLWAVFYLTYSNGSFASLMGALALSTSASRKKFVWLIPLAAAACGAGLVVAFSDRIMPMLKVASVSARLDYWKAGIMMVLDRPLLGSGPGTFGALYSRYMIKGAEETQLAHNAYIQVWIESGTIAFVSYCLFWIMPLVRSVRFLKTSAEDFKSKALFWALSVGLAAFVLHNAVDFDHFIPGITVTALALMALCRVFSSDGTEKFLYLRIKTRLIRYGALVILSAFWCALVLLSASHCYSSYLQVGASRAAQAGKMDTALTMARAATVYNPFNSSAFYLHGNLNEYNRNFNAAQDDYENAVKRSPNIAAYRYSLGRIMLRSGRQDPRQAIFQLMKAVQAYPANERYQKDLSDCLKNYDIDLAAIEERQKG